MPDKLRTGRLGEEIACTYLASKKYKVLTRNYRTRYGEIDIIARKDATIAFVEVKTRIGLLKGKPYEAITPGKKEKMKQTARLYVLQNKMKEYKLSMQAVSIVLKPDLNVLTIDHFEDLLL